MTTKKRTYTACCPSNARRQSRGGGTCIATPTDESNEATPTSLSAALCRFRELVARPFKPKGKTMPKGRSTPDKVTEAIRAYLVEHEVDIKSKKKSLNSVADKFDVAFSVVKTQADRLQFEVSRGGPRSSKNRAKVLKLIEAGKNPTQIADKLGISRQEVYRLGGDALKAKKSATTDEKSEA